LRPGNWVTGGIAPYRALEWEGIECKVVGRMNRGLGVLVRLTELRYQEYQRVHGK
jgi:hypothetical protein